MLADPAITGAVVVATPEEMPVTETIELVDAARDRDRRADLAAVIVNRVLPELFGRGEEAVFDRLCSPRPTRAQLAVGRSPAGRPGARRAPTSPCACAGRGPSTSPGCATELPATSRCSTCPYLFTRGPRLRATRTVAEALGAELGY